MSKAILIDQNHSERQIIFKKQLAGYASSHPNQFKWINLLSKPVKRGLSPERLTNQRLEKIVSDNLPAQKDTFFYICGPTAFMRMAEFTLKLMGFKENQLKKEHFTVDYIPPPPLFSNPQPRQLKIHYKSILKCK